MSRRIVLSSLFTLILVFLFNNKVFAQCNGIFPYDWEIKHISSGGTLSISQPAVNLPNGTPITFSVIKRSGDGNGTINTSGAQGGWDMQGYISTFCSSGDIPGNDQLDKHYAMLASIGVKYANLSIVWPYIENTQGNFNFKKLYDPIFKTAKKYNISLVPNLINTPRWATSIPCQTTPKNTCKENLRCKPSIITRENGSPHFNNFVKKIVERYKPNGIFYQEYPEEALSGLKTAYGIKYWVIGNEPDNGNDRFWTDCSSLISTPPDQDVGDNDKSAPRASMNDYADFFSGAYNAIKETDRQAKVLLAGLVLYDKIIDNKFALEVIYDRFNETQNSKPDIINLHSYQPCKYDYQGNPTTICTFKNVIAANAHKASELDEDKDVWLVEFGPILSYTPIQINEFLLESAPMAFNYVKTYPIVGNPNFDKTFWWPSKGNIPQDPHDPGTIFGLMHPCFEPRETYFTAGKQNGAVGLNFKNNGSVINGQIKTTTPIQFQQGKYIVIATSPNKMVINKPIAVYAGEETPNCPSAPTSTPTPTNNPTPTTDPCPDGALGNVNCDPQGKINESDLNLILISWTLSGPTPTPAAGRRSADLNGDGKIDETEVNIILRNWNP